MSVSRDLFLLSAIAFQQGQYDKAASLFASSLSADDANEFLDQVDQMVSDIPLLDPEAVSSGSKASLSSIAQIIKASMKLAAESTSAADFDEEDTEEDPSEDEDDESPEDEDDESTELESDDADPDNPGERIIPSALSSVSSAIKVK